MEHIPGILNPNNDLSKPLDYTLHAQDYQRILGYYTWISKIIVNDWRGVEIVCETNEPDVHMSLFTGSLYWIV